ncbi:NUDIX domain-containing protein [Candidatus Nomurabacteria bacterium]|nr:NUDIX domain-containing protein [Candidatus Nomurabacteria bacterium]
MKVSVSIIIENSKGEFLFFLRDDKETIPYPNHWCLLGGRVEEGETFEETIVREMKEEIELELKDFETFKKYEWPERTEIVFYKKMDLNLDVTPLHEGQKLKFFTTNELLETDLVFCDNEIMRELLRTRE